MLNQKGFTLAEVLTANTISIFLVVCTFASLLAFQDSVYGLQARMEREDLAWRIQAALQDHRTLEKSIAADSVLAGCFSKGPATALCPGGTVVGVGLVDFSGSPLSGPPANPVGYNRDGSRCYPAADKPCAIEVTSTARPQNVAAWDTHIFGPIPWNYFEIVDIRYRIEIRNGLSINARVIEGSVTFDLLDTGLEP